MAFSFDDTGDGANNGSSENSGTGDAFGGVSLGSSATTAGNGGGNGDDARDAFGTAFDPAIHSGRDKFNSDGSYSKKRGRRAGGSGPSASGQRSQTRANHSSSIDAINALSNTLIIVHAGISSVTKVTELQIDKTEGDALAAALANILAEFDIAPDKRTQAIVGGIVTAGTIYGPRFYLYNERMKAQKKKPATLHVLNPGGANADTGIPLEGG